MINCFQEKKSQIMCYVKRIAVGEWVFRSIATLSLESLFSTTHPDDRHQLFQRDPNFRTFHVLVKITLNFFDIMQLFFIMS